MRFAGRLVRVGRWYAAEVPMLGVDTQGRTKAAAYAMVKDAIECLVGREGFEVTVYPGKGNYFEVGANDHAVWVAFLLRRQRFVRGISLAEVTEKLGLRSRNAFARYEQGRSVPSANKMLELLQALGTDVVMISPAA